MENESNLYDRVFCLSFNLEQKDSIELCERQIKMNPVQLRAIYSIQCFYLLSYSVFVLLIFLPTLVSDRTNFLFI